MIKRGIDIAAHQGDINLDALKNQIDFVIIRVGYGVSGTIDNKFKRNADLCEKLGIPYGFYWYSYALDTAGAEKEADAFLSAIRPYKPSYGCWFDMEDADGYKSKNGMPSNKILKDICYAFCEKVENAGYYTGIYASQSWFNNKLSGDRLNRFDKWVAQWPTSGGIQKGLNVDSNSRNDISMWQFTSAGRFSGYNGNLDTNYAYHEFPNPRETSTKLNGSILELAIRVVKGEFGDGEDRKNNLGDRYNEVQAFINHIYSAPIDILAKEVKEGKYSDGEQRKTILGSKYKAVQNKITEKEIYKGSRVKFTGTKSYSGITLANWTHNDIFNVIEISGDRIVIGKGTVVTAAVNIKDCKLV